MSKRCIFSSDNAVKQNFAFHTTVIRYICTNPIPSTDFILKLYYCCKYFYPKMKIIPVDTIVSSTMYQCTRYNSTRELKLRKKSVELEESDFSKFDFKVFCDGTTGTKIICDTSLKYGQLEFSYWLNKKIWYFKRCYFRLYAQILTVKEYHMMAAAVYGLYFHQVKVFRLDGSVLDVVELLDAAENIRYFSYYAPSDQAINYKTATNLSKLIAPIKLCSFKLGNVSVNFDAFLFTTFLKNNMEKNSSCTIRLRVAPNDAKVKAFESIVLNELQGPDGSRIVYNLELHIAGFTYFL